MIERFDRVLFWCLQISVIASLLLWATFDPAFDLMIFRLRAGLLSPAFAVKDAASYVGLPRIMGFAALVGICLATASLRLFLVIARRTTINSGILSGRRVSLRSIIAMVTLSAAWCGLAVNYATVAMKAKGVRVSRQLDEFEVLAAPLRSQWPKYDGSLPQLGPFMAYPFGRPSTLILLQPPLVARGKLAVSTIERDHKGAIRFLLGSESSGTDYGDWIEWHPEGSYPSSFLGGLDDFHAFRSCVSLGTGWFLVRYDA